MASVDDVVALALPVLYCSGTSGVAGTSCSPAGVGGSCFFEPPKDQDLPAFKNPELGLDDDCVLYSVWDFLLAESFQSSCAFRSAEEGVVEALLCREELSVEFVFVVLDDPLPLAEESAPYPPGCPVFGKLLASYVVRSRHELPG